jgi:peptidoglycan hydrolase-like protein with peptidoglycan-binding domain
MEQIATGCLPSKKDKRTVSHSSLSFAGEPLVKGGTEYMASDIEHQHAVGICTAISMIQNREKANGKHYSPEFQYLLQKKFIDGNWTEGSSVLNALKVAKNYGFLPIELFTYVTEQDRYLPYSEYIKKLQGISDAEVQRLIGLCVDKIGGYASVVNDSQSIARAINESESGVLCRFGCQSNWWTSVLGYSSWAEKDISPLRWKPETSGHAIGMTNFDYTTQLKQTLANTWGKTYCRNGSIDIIFNTYMPTEIWTILDTSPMFKFTKTMKFGMTDPQVKELQKRLSVIQTGFFGLLTLSAVKKYQISKGLKGDGIVGPLTLAELNK